LGKIKRDPVDDDFDKFRFGGGKLPDSPGNSRWIRSDILIGGGAGRCQGRSNAGVAGVLAKDKGRNPPGPSSKVNHPIAAAIITIPR